MRLRSVRAIYKGGALVFSQPELTPRDGTEVILTYLDEGQVEGHRPVDPVQALRGRGKGERLVENLLASRQEDRDRNESGSPVLRT
jgi:hypothetical protein